MHKKWGQFHSHLTVGISYFKSAKHFGFWRRTKTNRLTYHAFKVDLIVFILFVEPAWEVVENSPTSPPLVFEGRGGSAIIRFGRGRRRWGRGGRRRWRRQGVPLLWFLGRGPRIIRSTPWISEEMIGVIWRWKSKRLYCCRRWRLRRLLLPWHRICWWRWRRGRNCLIFSPAWNWTMMNTESGAESNTHCRFSFPLGCRGSTIAKIRGRGRGWGRSGRVCRMSSIATAGGYHSVGNLVSRGKHQSRLSFGHQRRRGKSWGQAAG